MMRFLRAVTCRRRLFMTHCWLVGSVIFWLILAVCHYMPHLSLPLPSLHRLKIQFMYSRPPPDGPNPDLILKQAQQKLDDLSTILDRGMRVLRDVEEMLDNMNEVNMLLSNSATQIDILKLQLVERTNQNRNTNRVLPSIKHEELARKVENGINEMWYSVSSILRNERKNKAEEMEQNEENIIRTLNAVSEEYTLLLHDLHSMKEASGSKGWRQQEAKELSELVQTKLYKLQHPEDCKRARLFVTKIGGGCGFGCLIHKLAYDFMLAIGLNRTLVLSSSIWSYHKKGWEAAFLPISKCEYRSPKQVQSTVFDTRVRVLHKYANYRHIKMLPFMPRAIPAFIAPRLLRLHGQPFVWWVGQLVKYLMRPQPYVLDDFERTEKWLGFKRPIVGVHIRRSDKLGVEADFHSVAEYMEQVELYYNYLSKRGPVDKKRIYLATDGIGIHADITKQFPEYEIITDKLNSKLAEDLDSRYTGPSLRSIIMDIHFLSMTDYLVCTFSSQVCRLAYELMQTQHPDASNWFHSLDDIYYFGEQMDHLQEVLIDHVPRGKDEIELRRGDVVKVAGNHWDGYSKGLNLRTGKDGLYPSFKVKEHKVISTEFDVNDTIRRLNLIRSQKFASYRPERDNTFGRFEVIDNDVNPLIIHMNHL